MFTGLTNDLGRVRSVAKTEGGLRLEIESAYDIGTIDRGASIACSGVCLTVADKGDNWVAFDVSAETLDKTSISGWQPGDRVNLEKPLRVGDELGGHIVAGHVDGTGEITALDDVADSIKLTVHVPAALMPFISVKGSITVDGVSLTVNELASDEFSVNLVPHTIGVTSFRDAKVGQRVNIEVDLLARYLARLLEARESD
jgi:riboflavin synthase